MKYVIATDSRFSDEVLFMVDRKKQRASFWSNRTDDAFVFADKGAAQAKCRSLRFNNPRVMPLTDAWERMREIERDEDYHAAMSAVEDGWDGHKNAF